MAVRYRVTLTAAERAQLEALAPTATALGVSGRTVERVKKRCVEAGLAATLRRKPRAAAAAREIRRRLQGPAARAGLHGASGRPGAWDLAAVGGSGRDPGADPRDFRHERAPHSANNARQPHRQRYGHIPPTENAPCVARREDVLDVYPRP